MDSSERALAKLRAPDGEALTALARLVVDEATATPLRDIAEPKWIASQIATAVEAATRGDHVRNWASRRLEAERTRWHDDDRTLRGFMPPEAEEPLRALLERPYVPDEDLLFRMMDQPAIQGLIRELLVNSITRFRKRLHKVDDGLLGGMGQRAARRGRGLLGGVRTNFGSVAKSAGNITGMAENLVGGLRDEMENAVDGKVKDFARGATTDAIRNMAASIADPANAEAFSELRHGFLDVLLDTPIRTLADEADKLGPEAMVDVVLGALRSTVSADDFTKTTEARIASVLEQTGDGTLGAWLDEVGLREVWSDTTTDLVSARLRAVVTTPGFEAWWTELFA